MTSLTLLQTKGRLVRVRARVITGCLYHSAARHLHLASVVSVVIVVSGQWSVSRVMKREKHCDRVLCGLRERVNARPSDRQTQRQDGQVDKTDRCPR